MESIKKMNLSAIEDALSVSEMQEIQAGSACNTATGAMCAATVIFAFSPLFCLAPAYAIGCGLGIYAGCGR